MLDRVSGYRAFERVVATVAALRRAGHVNGADILAEWHVDAVRQLLELADQMKLEQQFTDDLLARALSDREATASVMATVAARGLTDVDSVCEVLGLSLPLPESLRENVL